MKKKRKKQKAVDMKTSKTYEIVKLPNGSYQWLVKERKS